MRKATQLTGLWLPWSSVLLAVPLRRRQGVCRSFALRGVVVCKAPCGAQMFAAGKQRVLRMRAPRRNLGSTVPSARHPPVNRGSKCGVTAAHGASTARRSIAPPPLARILDGKSLASVSGSPMERTASQGPRPRRIVRWGRAQRVVDSLSCGQSRVDTRKGWPARYPETLGCGGLRQDCCPTTRAPRWQLWRSPSWRNPRSKACTP